MIESMFSGRLWQALERYLDLAAQRQKAISSNLANIDTPGYRALDLDIQGEMRKLLEPGQAELQQGERRHLRSTLPVARGLDYQASGEISRNDFNNVELEKELVKQLENAMGFSIFASILRSKLNAVLNAVNEGRQA